MNELLMAAKLLAAMTSVVGIVMAMLSCNKDDKIWKSGMTVLAFGLGLKLFVG